MLRHTLPLAALALAACQEPPAQHGCWYDLVVVPADVADLDAIEVETADLSCTRVGEGADAQLDCMSSDGSLFASEEDCEAAADTLGQTLLDADREAELTCFCDATD